MFSPKDFKIIINLFDTYPLKTQKFADYDIWKQVFYLVLKQEHLTMEGLQKILALKASMNRGLTATLKSAFPEVVPIQRPLVKNKKITNPNWLPGFSSGEGSFLVGIQEYNRYSTGFQVHLAFVLTQHIRDEELIINLIKYFGLVILLNIERLLILELQNFLILRIKLFHSSLNIQFMEKNFKILRIFAKSLIWWKKINISWKMD